MCWRICTYYTVRHAVILRPSQGIKLLSEILSLLPRFPLPPPPPISSYLSLFLSPPHLYEYHGSSSIHPYRERSSGFMNRFPSFPSCSIHRFLPSADFNPWDLSPRSLSYLHPAAQALIMHQEQEGSCDERKEESLSINKRCFAVITIQRSKLSPPTTNLNGVMPHSLPPLHTSSCMMSACVPENRREEEAALFSFSCLSLLSAMNTAGEEEEDLRKVRFACKWRRRGRGRKQSE